VNDEKRLPGTGIAAPEKQKDRIAAGSAMALPFISKCLKRWGSLIFIFPDVLRKRPASCGLFADGRLTDNFVFLILKLPAQRARLPGKEHVF
jgi:hypothetical protein